MNLGILRGGFWGDMKEYWGRYWSPQNLPSRFPGFVSTHGLFQAWIINNKNLKRPLKGC